MQTIRKRKNKATMSVLRRSLIMGLIRYAFVVFIMVSSLASRGECARAIKESRDLKSLYENEFPREPVPPSGPSPCHNSLGPYQHNQLSNPQSYIICP
ncbi:hypothetical protein LOK49_LG03G00918 [Camellia lanceoleosa]|uniref:Uncharacterized protein n=1 Tax=Camellia lanceoleosa TaxID=1840588 RepID=A0ACC0I9J8_9ERIC|nr:hypothetical protein LOK49_LG03G00918 [Camellia lanceoleosa]